MKISNPEFVYDALMQYYMEDEYFSAIENRDTALMKLGDKLKEQGEKLKEKDEKLKEQGDKLKEKDNKLKEKDNTIKAQRERMQKMVQTMMGQGMTLEQIAQLTGFSADELQSAQS